MNKKIIVSGRPRSGTSLMMRILDVSGYTCARDKKWEEHLGKTISNPYFYESKDLIKGKLLTLKDYDAGKIMVNRLNLLKDPSKFFIIWMDRNKDSMFKSWDSYNREKFAKISNDDDYNRYNDKKILRNFDHIRINFENLVNAPEEELLKLNKFVNIDISKAKKEIDPNLKHY